MAIVRTDIGLYIIARSSNPQSRLLKRSSQQSMDQPHGSCAESFSKTVTGHRPLDFWR